MKDWFMNIDEVQLITFSPTCTSKQVGEAIVHGTGISSVSKVDLTLEAAGKREVPSHALKFQIVQCNVFREEFFLTWHWSE